jgi:hypothetical protein
MATMPPEMKVKQTNLWVAPDSFRQESQLPFGKVVVYSDGKSGWMSTPQGVRPLPGAQLKQVREELFRIYFRLLLSDRDPDRSVTSPEEGVIEITGKDGNSVKLYIDPNTGLPAKEVYSTEQPNGTVSPLEEIFDDFQQAGGIKVPKKITVNQNGKKFGELTIEEYKFNSGLKTDDLSKKP